MKQTTALILALLLLAPGMRAEEKNGLRVSVQKTTLDKEQSRPSYNMSRVAKELALKITVKNVTFKDIPEGTLDYIVIVRRWGRMPELYQRYSGTETVPALKAGEEKGLIVGKVKMAGYETLANHKQYQDSLEAWQIAVKQNGVEMIKLDSTGSFEKLNAKAKDGPK